MAHPGYGSDNTSNPYGGHVTLGGVACNFDETDDASSVERRACGPIVTGRKTPSRCTSEVDGDCDEKVEYDYSSSPQFDGPHDHAKSTDTLDVCVDGGDARPALSPSPMGLRSSGCMVEDYRIVVACGNAGKMAAMSRCFGPELMSYVVQEDHNINEIQGEDGCQATAIAIDKCWKAVERVKRGTRGTVVIVEDTSFTICALSAAREWPGGDAKNALKALGSVGFYDLVRNRSPACYVTSVFVALVVCADGVISLPVVFRAKVDGVLVKDACGTHGMGWDDRFMPDLNNPFRLTLAQLGPGHWDDCHQRVIALNDLREWLEGVVSSWTNQRVTGSV